MSNDPATNNEQQNGLSYEVGKIEQLSSSSYPIDQSKVSELYDRAERPAPEGDVNRKTLTFTITPQTDQEWRDFLQTFTGTQPRRGKGISSAMVELSMQLLMASIANFRVDELAQSLSEISASEDARQQLASNLRSLADILD